MDSREIQPGRVGNGRDAGSGQIKAEIGQTRDRIDETLEALGDKLHPRHLLEEILDYVRSPGELKQTAGKLGQGLWHQVQQHPMPSLLIGAGLAWMLSEQKQRRDLSYVETGEYHAQGSSSMAGSASHMAESAKAKVGELTETVKEKTGELTQSIKQQTMHQAGRLKNAADRIRTEGWVRAGAAFKSAEGRFAEATHSYPLAVGLGFLAIGALAGLSLPRTRMEDRTLGPRADELKETVREQGQQVMETAKKAGSAALSAAEEQAKAHGLTPQNLGEKVKHVAGDAIQAATHSAQKEGLEPEVLTDQVKIIGAEAKRAAQEEIERSKKF